MAETVRVICRARPLNKRETKLGCKDVLKIDNNVGQIGIVNPADEKAPPKSFTFDGVYGVGSTTEQIYADVGFPLVESVMEGYNGTVFAYGQTGCGKSFTMQGINDPVSQKGIIPRAFEHIFEAIAVAESTKYLVHGSYCEIYNEEIRDLLGKNSKAKLDLKEHPEKGVYVQGLTSHAVNSVAECKVLMEKGWSQRAVGETLMNADSSRSHSIFSIYLEMCDDGEENGEEKFKAAKLNLVDLAGSERQAKTGATGDRLKEATKINLSLSALGNVISALVDGRAKHIPYRDSKLTRLLQDSLGGNTKTLMVAALSPADNNYDETLSTLRYANRAKNIKNKPKINEDPKDALLREYQEEIKKLKSMLTSSGMGMIAPPQPQQLVITETKVVEVEKIVTVENKEAIEREKQLLRDEYEAKLSQLREEFEAEKNSNASIEAEVQKVQQRYEAKMADFILEEAKNQEQIQKQKAMEMMEKMREEVGRQQNSHQGPDAQNGAGIQINGVERETGGYMDVEIGQQPGTDPLICPPDSFPHPASSLPAPTSSPEPASPGAPEVGVVAPPANLIQAEAALQRLQELQMKMVGGEQKGDEEIKDKRKKKMSHAMKRKLKLMQAIEKMEDDGILIKTYENIHEELRHKTQNLEAKTGEVEKLEREITDLQAEFEFDRIDYLATIRQQDKQMKLLTSLLERVAPTVRRDCNYSNIDRVKADATWDEESGEWTLPDLKVEKVSLPSTEKTDSRTPESIMPGGRPLGPGGTSLSGFPSSPRNTSNFDVETAQHEDRYLQRLQRQNEEASDYFKPKRAEQLLGDMKSTKQSGFSSQSSTGKPTRDPWSGGGGVRDSNHHDPLSSTAFHPHHRDVVNPASSTSLNGIAGHASPDGAGAPGALSSNMARPGIKLEALPPRSTTAKRRKNKKPNALEPL